MVYRISLTTVAKGTLKIVGIATDLDRNILDSTCYHRLAFLNFENRNSTYHLNRCSNLFLYLYLNDFIKSSGVIAGTSEFS